jgi:hypothetical protein
METNFAAKVEKEFKKMIEGKVKGEIKQPRRDLPELDEEKQPEFLDDLGICV